MGQPLAVFAALSFAIAMALKKFGLTRTGEAVGIFFHVLLLPVVAKLPAPEWAHAAGYLWLGVDIAIGAAALNDLKHELVWPVRLGGHVLAGIWIVSSSLQMSGWMYFVGLLLGVYLGGYSFVARFVHPRYLIPTGVLMLTWLTGIVFAA